MAAIRPRHNRFEAKVRIPLAHRPHHDDREFLYRTLKATSRKLAQIEADQWENALRVQWAEREGLAQDARSTLRRVYEDTLQAAAAGRFQVHTIGQEPVDAGIDYEIEKIAEATPHEEEPSPEAAARLAALHDARTTLLGRKPDVRHEFEPSFSQLASDYMKLWKTQTGLKESNTEQQKRATFALFAGYWRDKPIRGIGRPDAARFMDALRHLDSAWARSSAARAMTWDDLQDAFGGRDKGLSDATRNRHAATLQALWEWASERGYAEGRNPFSGHRTRLRAGVNVKGYRPWEPEELERLLNPGPKRSDLREVMLVALFSGMRLDEIASLTWANLKKVDGIDVFDVRDAKTPAGNRQVPVHPSLSWLVSRTRGKPKDRLWPGFNPEGPGKKAGADAGKEFTRFKQSLGFADRQAAFHSFRKNAVAQWEAASVPETEVAQIVGHEKKGITFGVYGRGVSIQRRAQIVSMLKYPGVAD
ncbi:tyrosine-type recombinase/integrase [Sphingomonas phyllosphaerae]|uniref:tyrosine-type recombinase/integrase n=1 Tax=Sphingomonas phyllosphaerae TaxID=257003 RepID=UPI0003F8CEC4|nr:tyrosine-type recombinase/integrase [Sphingomonas phyllosphaerae]